MSRSSRVTIPKAVDTPTQKHLTSASSDVEHGASPEGFSQPRPRSHEKRANEHSQVLLVLERIDRHCAREPIVVVRLLPDDIQPVLVLDEPVKERARCYLRQGVPCPDRRRYEA